MAVTEVPGRSGKTVGRDSCEDGHEDEAFARRDLDRTSWWHRCFDHLSSRLRADCRISPLILFVRFSAVDQRHSSSQDREPHVRFGSKADIEASVS